MLVIIDESAKEVVKIDREEKLKELMDGYSKLVFSICYRLTNDYFTAEDLTQETSCPPIPRSTDLTGATSARG